MTTHTDWYRGKQSEVRIVQRHGGLVTFECWYPMVIHPEVMTHRVFSRNAQSNRAMPMSKMRDEVRSNPYVPIEFKKNKPGMAASDEDIDVERAKDAWFRPQYAAFMAHEQLEKLGLHKQWTNRILWPYQHIRVLITATEWDNFFNLRLADDAMPEIRELASLMNTAMLSTHDSVIGAHTEWHLPYITLNDLRTAEEYKQLAMISSARCARVSYDNLDGSKADIDKDFELAKRLLESHHMSPFEHAARKVILYPPLSETPPGITHVDKRGVFWSANFRGPWSQFRQELQYAYRYR